MHRSLGGKPAVDARGVRNEMDRGGQGKGGLAARWLDMHPPDFRGKPAGQ